MSKDEYKILGAVWWTPPMPNILCKAACSVIIGAVAIESHTDSSWKVYMGFGMGLDQETDRQYIASHGMPIGSKEAACGFFPSLDPDKFKY